jgi:anaerobic selenocysteine-containing dehydrogenase
MKQHSPARLTQPLKRKSGAERGAAEFEPISWDEALSTLAERLAKIRSTDPKKFALFTGRDQMQALTGLFARQFGTPNYAAHGGFCSVNMAAGMIYTIGGSFWEFGGPDLDRARLFVMIGTAEDHHSNPLKIAISKFKRSGGRFISINPVRTGYSAIADEWIPIRPGTDGALLLALTHELVRAGPLRPRVRRALHQRELAAGSRPREPALRSSRCSTPRTPRPTPQGQDVSRRTTCGGTRRRGARCRRSRPGVTGTLEGSYVLPGGKPVKPASSC